MERERERVHMYNFAGEKRKNKTREPQGSLRLLSSTVSLIFVMFSSFFGGERKHSHFPKLKSEKVKILTSPSIFADVGTKITVVENILHAFSLDKTEPEVATAQSLGRHTIWCFIILIIVSSCKRNICYGFLL